MMAMPLRRLFVALARMIVVCMLLTCTPASPAADDTACPSGARLSRTALERVCLRDNGVREGPGTVFYDDGVVREAGLWRDNKRHGHWIFYREDGSLWQEGDFSQGAVQRIEPALAPCGANAERHGAPPPAGRAVWCQERGGGAGTWRNHGPFMAWYSDGRPQAQGRYRHGEPEGEFAMWFADGSLKTRGAYLHGKEQGLWLSWHDNGNLFIRAIFDGGKENGPWVSWWEEGSKCAEGEFRRGLEAGPWTFWRPSGVESEEGFYTDGKKDGWWRVWDADGRALPSEQYRAGVRVGSGVQQAP